MPKLLLIVKKAGESTRQRREQFLQSVLQDINPHGKLDIEIAEIGNRSEATDIAKRLMSNEYGAALVGDFFHELGDTLSKEGLRVFMKEVNAAGKPSVLFSDSVPEGMVLPGAPVARGMQPKKTQYPNVSYCDVTATKEHPAPYKHLRQMAENAMSGRQVGR